MTHLKITGSDSIDILDSNQRRKFDAAQKACDRSVVFLKFTRLCFNLYGGTVEQSRLCRTHPWINGNLRIALKS